MNNELPDPSLCIELAEEHIVKNYNSLFPLHDLFKCLIAYQKLRLEKLDITQLL